MASSKHNLAGKRIIISGAGPAGLIFARALDLNWPSNHPKPNVVIYERSAEIQPPSRDGYTIGIRVESGLLALHKVGLLQTSLNHSTTKMDSDLQKAPSFWDRHWNLLLQTPVPKKRPEGIPETTPLFIRLVRGTLRRILLSESTAKIHYEKGIENTRLLSNGRTEVELSDGTTDTCDLLVAADGSNSKIRNVLLPDQKLEFAGVVCYLGTSRFPHGKPAPLQERWGINLSGQGVPFLTFRVDDERSVWATSYRTSTPVPRIRGVEAVERHDEIIDKVHKLTHMFDDPCKQFIDATEPDTLSVFNAQHKHPIKHSEKIPNANVVFIGDANHPMSPFSGNGANMALLDGVVLAEQLIKHESSIKDAINAFDEESMPRSKDAIDKSWWTIQILHAEGWKYWLLRTFISLVAFIIGFKKN